MTSTVRAIAALLLSAAILLAGNGLQSTLISLRANLEGFSLAAVGLLMSAYFAGFISGCVLVPRIVARAGHIRAFAALSAIAAASALIFPLSVDFLLWAVLRAITGFCFAGLYMIVESWINERAVNENRGKVLSIYRIVDLAAITGGQFLLTVADPASFQLFSLVAILISLAIVPVSLTRSRAPQPLVKTTLDVAKLMRVSPLAVAGCFAIGLASGAFWGVGPVFVQALGYDTAMVAAFLSAAIIAGALAQWPLGLLSDMIDRRRVLVGVAMAAAASGVFLFMLAATSQVVLLIGAGLYGFFAMPMFGLSAAHANDHAERDEFVAVSGGLLLVFGLGSVVGPAVAPAIMSAAGPSALFAYTALVHSALFVFGVYRMTRRGPTPATAQADYVPVPRTTPGVFEMDPRAPSDDDVCDPTDDDEFAAPA
ncbi:MAG: MFS transporter [Pseudomonadota bacterium]